MFGQKEFKVWKHFGEQKNYPKNVQLKLKHSLFAQIALINLNILYNIAAAEAEVEVGVLEVGAQHSW